MVSNRWDPETFARLSSELDRRIYSSRLLGQDPELVMHGGGNTSLKWEVANLFGEKEEVLFIKGSGWDLATIEAAGFPAVRLAALQKLEALESLSDLDMMNYLRTQLIRATSPDPSVETLLHAFLPHRYVDHTHADAVLAVTNQPDSKTLTQEVFGRRFAVIPYIMPGFQLAKLCLEIYRQNPEVEGLILLHHGIFTFGETAEQSYDRMIGAVQRAEAFVKEKSQPRVASRETPPVGPQSAASALIEIRKAFIERGFRAILAHDGSAETLSFVNHPRLDEISQRGCLTPDHVIRTKALPLCLPEINHWNKVTLSEAFQAYEASYQEYFKRNCETKNVSKQAVDGLPRVLLVPGFGLVTAGKTAKEAHIALDIYRHTMTVILSGEALREYRVLPEEDLFDVEYWVLEQAKLKSGARPMPLAGKIAAITGGASGIGLAIAKVFLSQGAIVHVLDKNASAFRSIQKDLQLLCTSGNEVHFHETDVTRRGEVEQAVLQCIKKHGGLDIAVINAGLFPASALIEQIDSETWQRSLDVNVNGALHVVAEALKALKAQGQGGDVLFIASKNVPAPGKEAAAYSVAKAAQTQLARVCALEAGPFGIRVNLLHPHLIFDTALWSEELLEKRAKAYGLTVEEYKRNNLLKTALTSEDVAKAALALVSGYFSKTTGAQIPVDGGSDRTL